ncbi:MAG: N-acetylmuramoyl-L-alanine amidase, partial [Bacteroidota bacterium]
MLPITKQFLTHRRTRPALRNRSWYTIRQLKGIVAHWTANRSRGADAMANRNYFNTTDRYASAHYIIDDHSIIQCLPDHEVAYHVGGT